ncbi:MAG: hypothetical protein JF609_08820 [Verrucomicrobia bacterium]|nr:hypothetical protein [Verrucomicrobiota bacterium]
MALPMTSWTAVARQPPRHRLGRTICNLDPNDFRTHDGGVALRFPPQSMVFFAWMTRPEFARTSVAMAEVVSASPPLRFASTNLETQENRRRPSCRAKMK